MQHVENQTYFQKKKMIPESKNLPKQFIKHVHFIYKL